MTTKLTVDEVIKELKLEKKENHNIDTIIKEIRKEYTSSDTVVDLLKYWTKQYETSSVHNLEIDIVSDDNSSFKMIKPEDMAFTRNCCLSLKEVDYIKSLLVALTVGTVLFCINYLNLVIMGKMDTEKWVKMSVTYCVPFCTATYGQMIPILKKPKKQYNI